MATVFLCLEVFVDDLFEPLHHFRNNDPETSRMAAEKAEPISKKHGRLIMMVLDTPAHTEEIAERITERLNIEITREQIARRMVDLEKSNQAERTGEKAELRNGNLAETWRAK